MRSVKNLNLLKPLEPVNQQNLNLSKLNLYKPQDLLKTMKSVNHRTNLTCTKHEILQKPKPIKKHKTCKTQNLSISQNIFKTKKRKEKHNEARKRRKKEHTVTNYPFDSTIHLARISHFSTSFFSRSEILHHHHLTLKATSFSITLLGFSVLP